jgi:toxin ParE1/3/4
MRHEFHPEALEEYEAAATWYARRDPELAVRFVQEVERAIDQILEAPKRWRVIDQDVRRCLTRVFPYGILYTVEPESVLIVAVMHCGRKPGYWKNRI